MPKLLKRIVIDLFIIIVGTIIATVIIRGCGIDRGESNAVTMKANKGNSIQIHTIEYNPTVSIYNVYATDTASGAVVTVATPDLVKVPDLFKFSIGEYLKSHNLTEEELKK